VNQRAPAPVVVPHHKTFELLPAITHGRHARPAVNPRPQS
jgi:hypothetical protein